MTTGHASSEGVCSSTLSLTPALDGVGGQLHNQATLPSGKRTCTHFYSKMSGPQGLSGKVRKISPPPASPWRVCIVKCFRNPENKFYCVSVRLLLLVYIAGDDPSNLQV